MSEQKTWPRVGDVWRDTFAPPREGIVSDRIRITGFDQQGRYIARNVASNHGSRGQIRHLHKIYTLIERNGKAVP